MNPNTNPRSAADILSRAAKGAAYAEEKAILEFTEEVLGCMDKSGVTRTQLAERLGVDPAFVTKLMGGNNNFTLKTMVRVARALDCTIRLHLQPRNTHTVWRDYNIVAESATDQLDVSLGENQEDVRFEPATSYVEETTFHVTCPTST